MESVTDPDVAVMLKDPFPVPWIIPVEFTAATVEGVICQVTAFVTFCVDPSV
jgi:hypothetical protein